MRSARLPGLRRALPALVFLTLFPCGHLNLGDSEARFAQTLALVRSGRLDVPRERMEAHPRQISGVVRGGDERYYPKYPPGLSLIWVPPVAAAELVSRLTDLPFGAVSRFAVSLVNPLILVATVLSIGVVLRRLEARPTEIRLTQAAYLLGTTALPYASTSFSEPLVGLGLLWTVSLLLLYERSSALAGVVAAYLVLVKSEMALAIPLLAAAGLFRIGRRRVVTFLCVAATGPAATLLMNLLLRGDALSFGYQDERFHWPPPGLPGLVWSVDRSIPLFNPLLLAAAAGWAWPPGQRYEALRTPVALLWPYYFLLYSCWYGWHGGWSFGPRYFVSLLPLTILPAGPLLYRLLQGPRVRRAVVAGIVAVVLACSAVVQLAGVAVKPHQARWVTESAGGSQLSAQLRLLGLKLERGIGEPEVYHRSDFVALAPGEADTLIDHRHIESFQYLNFWWSLLAANCARGLGCPPVTDP